MDSVIPNKTIVHTLIGVVYTIMMILILMYTNFMPIKVKVTQQLISVQEELYIIVFSYIIGWSIYVNRLQVSNLRLIIAALLSLYTIMITISMAVNEQWSITLVILMLFLILGTFVKVPNVVLKLTTIAGGISILPVLTLVREQNSVSIVLAYGFAGLLLYLPKKYLVVIPYSVVTMAVLMIIKGRTALVSYFVMVIVTLLIMTVKGKTKQEQKRTIFIITGTLLGSLVIFAKPMFEFFILNNRGQLSLYHITSGRSLIWLNSIKDATWLGHGPQYFQNIPLNNQFIQLNNTHNLIVDQLVRFGGIVALVFIIIVLILLCPIVLKTIQNDYNYFIGVLLLYIIMNLLEDTAIGFNYYFLPNVMIMLILNTYLNQSKEGLV